MSDSMPRMRWFGPSWGSPMNADCEQVPVPLGLTCLWCAEGFEDEGPGVIYSNGPAAHLECFLRQTYGSVGHQRGLCICHGGPGTMDDPPGLTKRQAAWAAVDEWEKAHRR